MSEQFYDRILTLFFGFSLFLVVLNVNIQFLILYTTQQNFLYYYAWLAVLGLTAYYGVVYYRSFQNFRNNLGMFLPIVENNEKIEPLNMELSDKSLQVCLYYRNGATLEQIKANCGFNHANQVKRELIKGIGFLLTFYNENKQEDVKTK